MSNVPSVWPRRLGIAVILSGAAWLAFSALRGEPDPGPRFTTATLDRGDLALTVAATGTLSALVTVEIGSQVSGRIASLHADYNSEVKQGDLIARIDPSLFEAAVQRARANLAVAEANVERAEIQLAEAERLERRITELTQRKLVSQSELDTAKAQVATTRADLRSSKASVQQTRASLVEAEANLRFTNIVSPTDGIVISRAVNVGQTVAASLQAPVLFTLAQDLRDMQVVAAISEADIGQLKEGQSVSFTVDAFPDQPFEGTLRQIRNAANVLQNVVTFDAVIDVDNPELQLRPGMTANVSILVAEKRDAVRIPNAALRFRPPDSTPPARKPGSGVIWTLSPGGAPEARQVSIGLSDGQYTEWRDDDAAPGLSVLIGRSDDAEADGPSRRFRMF
ncbi:efflux RND transporter periplasmic adaptor subunit [Polycyclovorans algicola]|uniref:efflux RND transporter periplasmic adaptor subunit n=1 Tax=Polycyclovorans algicola TaxID=616992 RepID=UPI0005BA31E7|nr:efflux RND transporter periplasmic adaptor subunit [Polycyclovorans algicola]